MGQPNEHWDEQATGDLRLGGQPWFAHYHTASFLRAIACGLRHLGRPPRSVLKTDLWNEGVEIDRDVLSGASGLDAAVIGMDISHGVCRGARRRLAGLPATQGDIRSLPFDSGRFDLVLDLSTSDHVDETDVGPVLREYARVLRGDGVLVLVFTHDGAIFSRLKRLLIRLRGRNPWNQQWFDVDWMARQLEPLFTTLETHDTGTLTVLRALRHLPLPLSRARGWGGRILDAEYSGPAGAVLRAISTYH
ncbi:MAG: class I SAM-dependent methyltransferase, partial [Candidatus Riflebacteria bacterium]|nr:class I SAM-dependent methyltransferase [Candidatus Riflebacteria bacterium]